MPTENRSSNTEMVSVKRQLVEQAMQACFEAGFGIPHDALRDVLAQPAPQPHPDPIAWMVGTAIWWTKEEAERDAAASGKTITPFGPMFDTVEVERLKQELLAARAQGRAEVVEMIAQLDAETGLDEFIGSHQIGCSGEWGSHWKEEVLREHFDVDPAAAGELELARHSSYEIMLLEEERDTLRAQLVEAHALLRDLDDAWNSHDGKERFGKLMQKVESLYASAEPSAPIAWHVGGNGYNRICFEEPTDLPGHPCIQAIHDQRQLIELLKRYDLRDEDAPPDERAHGIPGTSFQRLNALANQGE
ncbi:hypothetical protein [Pseudomonas fulva]|uniref:hypothetical protein n=1 Tax=Pseudomonas fulva TaxID=47880 RepID=UPI001E3BC2B6|nr:hypothetical protein [Pseudomonas fulva]